MVDKCNLYKKIAQILKEPIIDEKSYEQLFDLVCNYFGLSEFLKKFNLTTYADYDDTLVNASYNHLTQTIEINKDFVPKYIEMYNEFSKVCSVSYYDFLIFYQLQCFFHEVGHVLQIKRINTPSTNKQEMLIKSILMDSYFVDDYLYTKSYNINPIEKDANIFAYSHVLKFFFNTVCDDFLKDYFVYLYICVLKYGYIDSNFKYGNTKLFYRDVLKRKNDYDNYAKHFNLLSYSQKIALSLPLNKSEANDLSAFCDSECYNLANSKRLMKKYLL